MKLLRIIALIIAFSTLTSSVATILEGSKSSEAVLVDFSMSVDGGALTFFQRVLNEVGNRIIILRINSYGGYLTIADEIVNMIIDGNVTCYAWIPPGGYAVSAASMIALACRGIFMGSGAVIGDAIPAPYDKKIVEYVAARFRSLAQRLFSNNETLASIAEAMVREGKTLTTDEAISIGFAKKANSINDVEKFIGASITSRLEPSLWDRLVSVASLPIISAVFLVAGAILIIAEILTTGFQGYAIAGAILIAIALSSMRLIPPDIVALTLLLSGVVLIAIEMFTPGFGVFGVGGAVLLVAGAAYQLYLVPPQLRTQLVYTVVGGIAVLSSVMVFIAYKAVEVSRMRRPSIEQQLLSSIGVAKTSIGELEPGVVYVLGEEWTAYSVKGSIPAGSKVRVVRVDGLKLYVESVEQKEI
ncbi:NfeD family protein [Ignisphaera sp. 4213-co]|uniref:NfeD family protein n=1 Tax=Ignisphaera cupida TaxID=3050454 RepID=A0ABD4Z891_9CREN|nr:NfeD family protein [Ignisphaera sp. 4213-co]MDK6029420.1 NfeD family protein [Ignisphaera sp. 4213-co]